MFEIKKEPYGSPRRSYEFIDCSMPMTFDQYSNCGYTCMYCFSTFQRSVGPGKDDYINKRIKKVRFNLIKRMFEDPDKYGGQFKEYIKKRIVLQRGGLSDPMCAIEEQEGLGLELLKFFNSIKYPIRFSSKSDLPLRDKRYLDEFRKGKDHFAFMSSIITYDPKVAEVLEAGTPTPERRVETLKALSDLGVYTILRLRPYIVGISDKTIENTINACGNAGVKAISTEFFCLEGRANESTKEKYNIISKLCGFDIIKFYRQHANTSGYLRLSRKFTRPYTDQMVKLCNANNIKLAVSCPKHKEKTQTGSSCCGMPEDGPLGNVHKGQYVYALKLAKEKGFVQRSDIAKENILGNITRRGALGMNNVNGKFQGKYGDLSLREYLRMLRNNPKNSNSPYRLFEGVLVPKGVDKDNNIIYFYNQKA